MSKIAEAIRTAKLVGYPSYGEAFEELDTRLSRLEALQRNGGDRTEVEPMGKQEGNAVEPNATEPPGDVSPGGPGETHLVGVVMNAIGAEKHLGDKSRAAILAVADWLEEDMTSWDAGPACAGALRSTIQGER